MKTMKLLCCLMILPLALIAGDFEVPENYSFTEKEDYAKYEKDVINCIDWLQQTPINEQTEKRALANRFLLEWLTGSPDVYIEIREEIVNFTAKSPELLMIFLGGWAKDAINAEDDYNTLAGNLAGIEAVIAFYKANKEHLGEEAHIERYIVVQDEGRLEAYIKERL